MKPTSLIVAATIVTLSFTADQSEAFTTQAFDPISVASVRSQTSCFLHPSQAADLEAVAYDLMKEAMEEKPKATDSAVSLTRDMAQKVKYDTDGPVSWCRRRLWPFQRDGLSHNEKLP